MRPPISSSGDRRTPEDPRAPTVASHGRVDDAHASTTPDGDASEELAIRWRPVSIGSRLGRHELLAELGQGGMATVYRGRDTQLRREVAVKVLFPHLCKRREVVARFQREARAVAALDHPHILRVHDVGGGPDAHASADGGRADAEIDPPYMVLELVRGGSLREHASAHGAVLGEVVAAIGAVMCSALSAAHEAGIIHRDIKPANIMIADGGRLVLADFGVARIEEEDSSLVTRTGALLGTPAFMSPEQAQGDPLDERSDVYSLGATLYQLATGSAPFGGPTPKVVFAIAHGELVPPLRRAPAIGADLSRVIEKMMARDPAARYATAAEAGAALAEVAADGGLNDVDQELAAYFAAPAPYQRERRPQVIAAALARARAAAGRGRIPQALALCDRVLALEPAHAETLALVDELGQGRRRRRGLAAGASALLIAAAGVGAYILATGERPAPSPAAAPIADAAITADTAITADAAMIVQATSPAASGGPTDPPPPAASGGPTAPGGRAGVGGDATPSPRHHRRDAGSIARTPVDAGVPVAVRAVDAAPPPPPADARLTVIMNAWCDLVIDGQPYGRADAGKPLRLPPGKHRLVCSQGPTLGQWSGTVDLAPGEAATVRGDLLAPVAVTVAVTGGDAVRIDGAIHANGATVRLRPGTRYKIELVKGGKPLPGGRYLAIPRGGPCTLRDQPNLACAPSGP